jgi:hypothetical protein
MAPNPSKKPTLATGSNSAFREIGYGVLFFLSAALGGFLGLTANQGPRSGTIESKMWEDVTAILLGTFCGAVAWLAFRYTCSQPRVPPESAG